jgi:hypothetical protein
VRATGNSPVRLLALRMLQSTEGYLRPVHRTLLLMGYETQREFRNDKSNVIWEERNTDSFSKSTKFASSRGTGPENRLLSMLLKYSPILHQSLTQ